MTDKVTLAAQLGSSSPQGFTLGLVCSRGDSSVSLNIVGPVTPGGATDGVPGEIRLDSGAVQEVVFFQAGDRVISLFEFKGEDLQTSFFSAKTPHPFLGRLARAHLLRVRYEVVGGTVSPTAFFRLPPNSRSVLERILKACGQSLREAIPPVKVTPLTGEAKWRAYDTWTSCILRQPVGSDSTVAEPCRESFPPDFGWCIDEYLAQRPSLLPKRDALVAADAYMEEHGGSSGAYACGSGS